MAEKKTQLVRYRWGKHTFEVMTQLGSVQKWRDGKLGLDNVLQSDVIWKNQSKGDKANAAELKEAFQTENNGECLKIILQKGEIQLTTVERREQVEQKRREIIQFIHKYYTDPRTNTPHPVTRIDAALTETKFRVDGDIPAEKQVQEALKKLPEVIPLRRSEILGTLTVPNAYLAQAQSVLSKISANIQSESYGSDGCVMEISLVPGDYDVLMSELNRVTKGEFQFDVQGQGGAATTEDDGAGKKGGKKAGKGRK